MKLPAIFLFGAGLLLATARCGHAEIVDLALVLAIDASGSVDSREYQVQRDGIAAAFEGPAIAAAVTGGIHHAIDVLVLEWSDPDRQAVTVNWTRITGGSSAQAFADKVRSTRRSSAGVTAIGNGLAAAGAALKRLPDQASRRVIDVSGDGMANAGIPPAQVRDALVADGVTINGLVMLNEEPWVGGYYDANVVGGPGAFLLQVDDYRSFAGAIQQKLVSEIVAIPPPPAFSLSMRGSSVR